MALLGDSDDRRLDFFADSFAAAAVVEYLGSNAAVGGCQYKAAAADLFAVAECRRKAAAVVAAACQCIASAAAECQHIAAADLVVAAAVEFGGQIPRLI